MELNYRRKDFWIVKSLLHQQHLFGFALALFLFFLCQQLRHTLLFFSHSFLLLLKNRGRMLLQRQQSFTLHIIHTFLASFSAFIFSLSSRFFRSTLSFLRLSARSSVNADLLSKISPRCAEPLRLDAPLPVDTADDADVGFLVPLQPLTSTVRPALMLSRWCVDVRLV